MSNTSLDDFRNATTALPIPADCGGSGDVNKHIVFWVEGVLLSTVSVAGLFGNTMMFYVLTKVQYQCYVYYSLLMQLLVADSISIALMAVEYSLRKNFQLFRLNGTIYAYIYPKFIYPCIKISYTWIMCGTTAIAFER